jgi:hypothetical protein
LFFKEVVFFVAVVVFIVVIIINTKRATRCAKRKGVRPRGNRFIFSISLELFGGKTNAVSKAVSAKKARRREEVLL